MDTFGERLKKARKEAGLTQKAVAQKTGMSQSNLSELENNTYPTSVFVPQLAHLYGVNARWLADGIGPRTTAKGHADEAAADPRILALWEKYSRADESVRALVDLMLQAPAEAPPTWAEPIIDTVRGLAKSVARLRPDKSATAKKTA